MFTTKPVVWYPTDASGPAWGYPNAHTLHDLEPQHSEHRQLQHVLAWKVFHVQICIRNMDQTNRNANTEFWLPYTTFYAESWAEIESRLYKDYFSAGVAQRFCWIVESWMWTEDCGWSPVDHL